MAKRKKGRPVHGWLIVDKPAGTTSTQVVAKARWALQAQKAGHAGTLDPLATGLLAVAFGEATKTVPQAQAGLKTYRFTVRFGAATASDDAKGEVTARADARPTHAEIEAALPAFTGEIEQVPPQVSAVRVEGARAYDLAREGVAMDLAPRPLWVERLEMVARPDSDHAEFELVCGKGGYVRAIARDLGQALGCLGHVTALRRTASGGFSLDQAILLGALDAIRAGEAEAPLLPVEAGLAGLPEVRVRAPEAARLRHGNAVPVARRDLAYGDAAWASCDGRPVALVTFRAGMLHPDRVLLIEPAEG